VTKFRALLLVVSATLFVAVAAILGLSAANANGSARFLGAIVPMIIGSHLCSRVVMHYGASGRRNR
jgi:phosphotransferase system  glucose/maltose/N-acetylglucosamine-specific IIC component